MTISSRAELEGAQTSTCDFLPTSLPTLTGLLTLSNPNASRRAEPGGAECMMMLSNAKIVLVFPVPGGPCMNSSSQADESGSLAQDKLHTQALMALMAIHKAYRMQLSTSIFILRQDK
ncbi:MAG: hypothetical protein FRX49_04094 [Trebouxia sp. A1-2]|nr:MAG: hypothetical protein FRX49_04094 [Trebouxia sp. A1-2]